MISSDSSIGKMFEPRRSRLCSERKARSLLCKRTARAGTTSYLPFLKRRWSSEQASMVTRCSPQIRRLNLRRESPRQTQRALAPRRTSGAAVEVRRPRRLGKCLCRDPRTQRAPPPRRHTVSTDRTLVGTAVSSPPSNPSLWHPQVGCRCSHATPSAASLVLVVRSSLFRLASPGSSTGSGDLLGGEVSLGGGVNKRERDPTPPWVPEREPSSLGVEAPVGPGVGEVSGPSARKESRREAHLAARSTALGRGRRRGACGQWHLASIDRLSRGYEQQVRLREVSAILARRD